MGAIMAPDNVSKSFAASSMPAIGVPLLMLIFRHWVRD